ncbi:MAG TPA: hypothetical protein VJU81_09585 [Methylomirabilota bacterium]|nr:hypothetical protein [Methylomirabilota bacterium]
MKKKKSAKKTVAKKAKAKKPAAKKAPARAKASKPAKSAGVGAYTPQPVSGIGWAPFRYPVS